MALTANDITLAIDKFNKGERPFRYTEARSWYVVDSSSYLYPLKYIYAIAINQAPSSFNTSEPISVLGKLGVQLLHLPPNTDDEFYSSVEKSIKDNKSLKSRLQNAPTKPRFKLIQVAVLERNPDVVAEVLCNAKGKCDKCNKQAPFNRKKDGSPFLEVHHKVSLASGGDDTVDNAEALCPNCHREKHYG